MKLRSLSYSLITLAAVTGVGLFGLVWGLHTQQSPRVIDTPIVVQAQHPPGQSGIGIPPLSPEVMVGEPEEYNLPSEPPRYTYRNEFPTDESKPLPLYVIDTQTGQEVQLGNESGAAVFGAQDENYLLWHFICGSDCREFQQGLYAHSFATQENRFISAMSTPIIHPLIVGDWIAFGRNEPKSPQATLYAANLQTYEVITLTQELDSLTVAGNSHFGISSQLATWYTFSYPEPSQIVVYDLATRSEIATLTDFRTAFDEQNLVIFGLAPGETVVTWSGTFGYDLVTQSYFRIPTLFPPDWDYQPIASMSSPTEQGRMLSWSVHMKDGSQRHIRAPLLDATPSTIPCVEGQNLVQNGDLEDMTQHALWQQSGNPSNLLVDDPPPGVPGGGTWAIRLGRYRNATHEIRQLLDVPSGVNALTLHFDVQVGAWDRWGGDWLEVDLVDPASGQSYLATPVRWRNTQLLSPGWLPLTVQIEGWPAVDAPVSLVFRGLTDWAIPTDFTIDNVRLVTTCQ
jgi:hypothetical protein